MSNCSESRDKTARTTISSLEGADEVDMSRWRKKSRTQH